MITFIICIVVLSLVLIVIGIFVFQNPKDNLTNNKRDDFEILLVEEGGGNKYPPWISGQAGSLLRQRPSRSNDYQFTLPRPLPVMHNNNNLQRNQILNKKNMEPSLTRLEQNFEISCGNLNDPIVGEGASKPDCDPHAKDMRNQTGQEIRKSAVNDSAVPDSHEMRDVPVAGIRYSSPLVSTERPITDLVGNRRRRPIHNTMTRAVSTLGNAANDKDCSSISATLVSSPSNCNGGSAPDHSTTVNSPPADPKITDGNQNVSMLTVQAITALPQLSIQDLQLTRVLGGGAFGQVWQGDWKGTPVAVKILSYQPPGIANAENNDRKIQQGDLSAAALPTAALSSFEAEVAMLASLRHPNICLYMGASLIPPNRAIVTELVSRGSLWDALRTAEIFPVTQTHFFSSGYLLC